jgi:hypothetical protein
MKGIDSTPSKVDGQTSRPFVCLSVCLSVALTACTTARVIPTDPAPVTVTYAESEAAIVNPERGLYMPIDLPTQTNFEVVRLNGYTLTHSYVRLDAYRERDLPDSFLEELETGFADARAGGIKVILRFAYNVGPYPDSEPDASEAQMLRHLEQLTPLLHDNADVIAWMRAGFIGAWGEWHTSTHGLDQDLEAKRRILTALLRALPEDRMVQLRYPTDIWRLYGDPLTEDQAFSGTDQARVGFHNDCFLASEDDWGTYNRGGINTLTEDQARLAEQSRFTPVGGESCNPNPPRSDCPTALAEMALMHFSEFNQSYHPRVFRGWERQDCLDEIKNRLGYRLVLRQAVVETTVQPGSALDLTVQLANVGFAPPINPRPVWLVLDGPEQVRVQLEVDPRRWAPGSEHTLSASLPLPADLPPGTYRLALWLPDASERLRDDARYSIQFANDGVWDEAHGWNTLTPVLVGVGP